MTSAKYQITELLAVEQRFEETAEQAQRAWPMIYKHLQNVSAGEFHVADEEQAIFDLVLAATAFDLQAVKNLFPAVQAERIETWTYRQFSRLQKTANTREFEAYARDEITRYGQAWQKEAADALDGTGDGFMPGSAVAGRLLHRWLGDGIRIFEVEISGKKTGLISPLMIGSMIEVLMPFVGGWKRIADTFDVIEEDLPFELDFETQGLEDWDGRPERKPPDGTIVYRDQDGKLTEKWFPPRLFDKLFRRARRTGTIYDVPTIESEDFRS